jgi:cytidylate kinase
VTAPVEVRVGRVARRSSLTLGQAAAAVRRRDSDRQQYLQRYYQSDVNDPNGYDLQINTGTVSLETAAQMVLGLIRSSDRQP